MEIKHYESQKIYMIKKCRFCKTNKFNEIVNLGNQPLSGVFPDISSKDPPKGKLISIKCKKCNLIQLKHSASINKIYGNDYGYNSSLSKLMVNHLKSEFNNLMNYLKPLGNISVLDIGSNDGTFLSFYKILGVSSSLRNQHFLAYFPFARTLSLRA